MPISSNLQRNVRTTRSRLHRPHLLTSKRHRRRWFPHKDQLHPNGRLTCHQCNSVLYRPIAPARIPINRVLRARATASKPATSNNRLRTRRLLNDPTGEASGSHTRQAQAPVNGLSRPGRLLAQMNEYRGKSCWRRPIVVLSNKDIGFGPGERKNQPCHTSPV